MIRNGLCLLAILSFSLFAGDWKTYTTANSGLVSNTVRCIVIDDNGNKWFGTDKGLSAFDGAKWISYAADGQKQTLADNSINDLAFEMYTWGLELWIATDNGVSVMGISSIDAVTKATPYRMENTGLIDNKVTAAAVDHKRHELWFGTPNGVSRFSASGWRNFSMTTLPILAWKDVTSIGIDDEGGWKYIGTKNGMPEMNGVARLRTSLDDVDVISSPSPYSKEWSGLYSADIFAVYVDDDGSQWYGTREGFALHDTTETKAGWDQFTTDEGLINDVVRAIVKEKGPVVWVGTEGGLSRFEYQFGEYDIEIWKFTNYTTADGLVNNTIHDLALERDGSLWIATAGGVSHFTGVTAVAEKSDTLPKTYGLVNNFPNPFNPTTTIAYVLPSNGRVELTVVGIDGRQVRGLVNMNQSAGRHSVMWDGRLADGNPAPTGIYTARLRFDGTEAPMTDSIKILLVK